MRRAIAEIKILEGILPICASCKKIRSEQNEWQQMEMYITTHSKAQFSHGLCPECAKRYLEEAGLASGAAAIDTDAESASSGSDSPHPGPKSGRVS